MGERTATPVYDGLDLREKIRLFEQALDLLGLLQDRAERGAVLVLSLENGVDDRAEEGVPRPYRAANAHGRDVERRREILVHLLRVLTRFLVASQGVSLTSSDS